MNSRRWNQNLVAFALSSFVVLGMVFPAYAQDGGSNSSSASTKNSKTSKVKKSSRKKGSSSKSEASGPGKKKVLVLDDSLVKGKVQRPEAFYILQNTELKYDELNGHQNFVTEIVEELKDDSSILDQK